MLPIIKSVKSNDMIQLTSGDNLATSFLITIEDLKKSLCRVEIDEVFPAMNWKKDTIRKWMDKRNILWNEDDAKKILLKKIED